MPGIPPRPPPDPDKPKRNITKPRAPNAHTRHGNGGWGGPAKGAGSGSRAAFDGSRPGPGRGKTSLAGDAKRERDEARAERMKNVLEEIAEGGNLETARVAAAQALLNRIEGMPVSRNINATVDDVSRLSDDELRSELEKLGGAPSPSSQGAAPASLPQEPDGVVH